MAFIVSFSGKGGVGKTTLTALVLDELARRGFQGSVLAVDGDPATTLHMALGLSKPKTTIADIRDNAPLTARDLRELPAGVTASEYVHRQINETGVIEHCKLREMSLDMISLGHPEGHTCYCAVNGILSQILEELLASYTLVVIDNEAGLEHLNRYRLKQVDLFLTVATPSPASQAVGTEIIKTARQVGMRMGNSRVILNRAPVSYRPPAPVGVSVLVPEAKEVTDLERAWAAITDLPDNHPVREALAPIIKWIGEGLMACV